MFRHASRWVTTFVLGLTFIQTGCAPAEPPAPQTPETASAEQPLLAGERSLLGTTALPAVTAADDSGAVELGVRFRSDAPGRIMGVRFYKGAGNTGTHTGSLWTASGSLLATATFQNETASGWQEVRFATPVTISADTNYVVSYHAPAGHYAVTSNGFASALDVPPLHAEAGSNGLYRYGTSGFPTNSFNASNYWVDVAFQPNDTTPPTAPTNLVATPGSSSAIELTWYPSVDGSGEVQGNARWHLVYRNNVLIAELPGNTLSYRDTGLNPSTGYNYAVRGRDAAGNLSPSSTVVTGTTLPNMACNPCSLWTSATGNPQYENADTTPAEIGVKFRTDVAGTVTKVRYYKGSTDNGPHVGHLWSATGTLLATTETTPAESGFGWRELSFPTPVSLTANTTYVVSYFATGGRYAITPYYFSTAGVDMPPLHAPSTLQASGNGVRNLNGSAFPTEAWLNTNFWVDVTFVPSAPTGPSTVDLAVTQSFPAGTGANGDFLFYDITVTNNGPAAATNVVLDVPIPTGLSYFFYSANTPGISGSHCGFFSDLQCEAPTLAPGASFTIHVEAIPLSAGTFISQATISSSESDFVPGNNTHALTIPVGPSTNLVTFEDVPGQDETLNGSHGPVQYGLNRWYIASPWGGFDTRSISFNGGGLTQANLGIVGQRRILGLDAFTWDSGATVTLKCIDLPILTFPLTAGEVTHLVPTWTEPCALLTVITSNGWDTNFDNLALSPRP
ncbi:DUF4082 domain-containing protein [Corallococcus sp. AB049A]|uniref:DUF4082 domain-containing protein n=1 Tax=Corallococcus interemptor TaxID=2316720 RepID=A0A3A8QAM0_9BACT|nr:MULTISPECIES: DUF4082 domain-containing protein [Corallococcus]RKH54057.1 DUF4082 domain-containing protein [Corallococcus sp. AB050B]RKH65723.1 DUF4082 domain-containing protein [Corallococcus interemptor]RKI67429.1 DUF4082 domain-containing protein [Corallococcus sp. AB049A]